MAILRLESVRLKYLHIAITAGLVFNAQTVVQASTDYAANIASDYESYLGLLWDHFHQHPELSFREFETAKRMAAELRAVDGIQVTEGVGNTGLVGVLRNGEGPVVLLRADMDGLPIEEKSGLPNMSKMRQIGVDGLEMPVMHACGHDVHITSMVGTARQLARLKDRWKGTVIFMVQPAEERVGGAEAMIADGLFTRFPKPDYALAFHVAAELPTGHISAGEGIQYSSSDSVDIIVHGVGTHGASPNLGRDPVYIASQIVVGLQSIISRELMPLDPGVITVGAFHAGSKHNIISDRAELQVTVRSNAQATRDYLIAAIQRVAINTARAHGVAEDMLPEVTVQESTPVTLNDAGLARRLNSVLGRELGEGVVIPFNQKNMGAEDFSYVVAPEHGIAGYYFAVGGTNPEWIAAAEAGGKAVAGHHSPLFKIDPEPAVKLGTEAMVAATLELLAP